MWYQEVQTESFYKHAADSDVKFHLNNLLDFHFKTKYTHQTDSIFAKYLAWRNVATLQGTHLFLKWKDRWPNELSIRLLFW